jgi:hypothetical protein
MHYFYLCQWLTQMKAVHMILQSCVCRGDWQTISTYDPPVLFVGEIDWHKWKQYVWSSSLVCRGDWMTQMNICVSQSLLQTQDWRIIRTAFICVIHWQTISTYDPPVLFVGEIDWHKWKQYIWSSRRIICTTFICVSQSPPQTRLEDHTYYFHLCHSISPTNKTGGSYVLLLQSCL